MPIAPAVHRYRTPRSLTVAGLAAMAATGTVLLTGAVSVTMVDARYPDAAIAVHAVQSAPSATSQRIQVGSFVQADAADAHLDALRNSVPDLAHRTPAKVWAGEIVQAQFAGFPDEAAARQACRQVAARGDDCFVVERPAP